MDLPSTRHRTLQKLDMRTVRLHSLWFLKLASFLHIATSEKQYHISKGELHRKAVIYRGHPSCRSYRLPLPEKVKTLICCGLENYFLCTPDFFSFHPFQYMYTFDVLYTPSSIINRMCTFLLSKPGISQHE